MLLASAIALLASTTALAQAAPSPAVQRGVAWLNAQVQADGSLAGEGAAIATPFQARTATALALSKLETVPVPLVDGVATASVDNTEYLARRIIAKAAAQRASSDDVTQLLATQNVDGGWGLTGSYQSDALDTALALRALNASVSADATAAEHAFAFLAQAVQSDGGWGVAGQGSVYVTAQVLRAAGAWSPRSPAAQTMAQQAVPWLLTARDATSRYGSDFGNSVALLAFGAQAGQSAAMAPLIDALAQSQLADGSWADDPYVTALAVHALWLASQPTRPSPTGSVSGTVVDQSTGLRVAAASVQLIDDPTATVSGADGSFRLSGLPLGVHTLSVSKSGYQTVLTTVDVAVGQILNVGVIALVPAPSTATLFGMIKDSSGNPLPNVTLTAGSRSVSTSAAGAYQIRGLSPGSDTITASLSGYQAVTATANFVAGNSYNFSPTLYTNAETVPRTSLQGTVIDRATSHPIFGATVTYNNTTHVTDANGNFLFTNATTGSFSIQIAAPGYLALNATGTLAAGVNSVGNISLTQAPTTARLSGIVKNSSGSPLPGVVVSAAGGTATTSATGAYQIADLSPGNTTITAALSGYRTATTAATLRAGNRYTFSPTLYTISETPPGTSLQGVVVSAATQDAIAGATVVLNGVSNTTDANGKFLFANATAGNFAIEVSASGFLAVNGTGTLAPGNNDLGTISLSPAPAATPYRIIASTGPLNKIFVGADLSSQVAHTGDGSYETYPPGTIPGDFGTFIVVGSRLYAPHFNSRGTATGNIRSYSPFTLVSQTDVLGTGATSDPFTVSTVANVGTTGLTIKQTDSYVIGQEAFRSDVTVTNTTDVPVSAILYRAMDCYLGNSDSGYGLATGVTVGCTKHPNNTPAGRIEEFVPLTGGAHYFEAGYSTVWRVIGSHQPFPDTCDCTRGEDNGMGLSWNFTVPANGSLTYSNLTVFSPLGNQPLVVTKTADSAVAAPGDLGGYTIKVSNLNARALPLYSITDSLPDGFVYIANSSTGVTTSDPAISEQTLTWNGPFNIAANGDVTLHFAVRVPNAPGTWYNQATANSGTNIVVPSGPTAPVTVNAVDVGVVTDKPTYPANATAQVITTLSNLNDFAVSGALTVDVYDSAGAHVGSVTAQQVTLPANGNMPITAPFAIGTIVPARYTVTAVLTRNDVAVATANTAFNVLPDNSTILATSTLHTDKRSYNASDRVRILSTARNLSANANLRDLTLNLEVVDASGAVQFTDSIAIAQLLAGQFMEFTTPQQLTNAAPGEYTVKQDLLDAQGNVFNHVEATYTVASSSTTGFGLVGTITATPARLPVGATLMLNATATDNGNSALNGLPLTITILDPDGSVVTQFTQTSDLAMAATVPFDASWITQGSPNTTYRAVLSATIGSGAAAKTVGLAQDSFTLTIELEANVSLSVGTPPLAALVLLDPDADPNDTVLLSGALAAHGYQASFVDTAADFAAGVRSGEYRLYLLLASSVQSDALTQRLLREAVHRGDGVLIASGADALPDALGQIAGLESAAQLPQINAHTIDVLGNAPGGAASVALDPPLASRSVVPQTALIQATLTGRLPATPDTGTLANEVAAHGRVTIAAFAADAGTNGTKLSLTSQGRLHNPDGSDAATVWRLRNSGASTRSVTLASVAGDYAQALTLAPHSDTFIASASVTGSADHTLSENGSMIETQPALTRVFADTRQVDVGANPGAIALWANQVGGSDVLAWHGAQHELHGAVHSNSDIVLTGAQNLIDGPLHYVSAFSNSGNHNSFTYPPRPVTPQPLPTLLNLADFAPGGPVQAAVGARYFDESGECGHGGKWHVKPKDMPLPDGVYYAPCDIQISGHGAGGHVTLIATGEIKISGSSGTFTPFYQGVQFATSGSGMHLSGSHTHVGGLVFAPHGDVQVSGSSMRFDCSIIADTIHLSGAKTVIDARQCAQATVQQQTPAVTWNPFGDGATVYAAFPWQRAIDHYEATAPGELTRLFDGALGEIAPTSNALRSGSVVPFTATVQSLADPFQGTLTLGVDDDSLLVPPAASWLLDFTPQTPDFQADSAVRLGAGTHTQLSATVAATAPVMIDPLKQTSATINHLPGESVADLIAAVTATGTPDAGLSAALSALQAAQTARAANDAEAALEHLLDAAEACGTSSNPQVDALRTRIDWVIWASTH